MQYWIGESRYVFYNLSIDEHWALINAAPTVRLWLPCAFLFFLFVQVDAVRLDQCRDNYLHQSGQSGSPNITYTQCVETCGGGAGEFKWTMFSQGFGSWLLPWIALIFQLPFGATGT